MPAVEESILIDRPSDVVYRFTTDPANVPRYSSNIVEYEKLEDGPIRSDLNEGSGQAGRETGRLLKADVRSLLPNAADLAGVLTRVPRTMQRCFPSSGAP